MAMGNQEELAEVRSGGDVVRKRSSRVDSKLLGGGSEEELTGTSEALQLMAVHMASKARSLPVFKSLLQKLGDREGEDSSRKRMFFEGDMFPCGGDLLKPLEDPLFDTADGLLDGEVRWRRHYGSLLQGDVVFGTVLHNLLNIAVAPIAQLTLNAPKGAATVGDGGEGAGGGDGDEGEKTELVENICTFLNTLLKQLLLATLTNEVRHPCHPLNNFRIFIYSF